MAFKMRGFSAFTKKTDDKKEYKPQSQIDPKDIPPPSVKEDKAGMRSRGDIMPQTEIDKASIDRLEGEIESIYDNAYSEAKDDNDTSAIKRYEKQMLRLKKEIESKGGKYTHIDMSNF